MRKLLAISLLPVLSFALLGAFVAIPTEAQVTPVGQCTLVSDVSISGVTVLQGSIVQSGPDNIVALDNGSGVNPATNPTVGVEGGPGITVPTSDWGSICLVNTVNKIVDWLFFIMLTVAFAFIVIAAFMWIMSSGSPEKQQAAGKMIVAALVGIVIALLAKILPAVVLGIVT